VVETIQKYFGPLLLETYIRDNVALAEAPASRQDIFDYAPSSNGAEDYLAVCKEIIERTKHPIHLRERSDKKTPAK
jgi:chromosome partitioning protein